MPRRPTRARLAVVIAATALAVLGLVGCAPREAGAAAVVGQDRLSVAQVQQQVQEYAGSLPNQPSVARLDLAVYQRRLVQDFVQRELFRDIAAERGITVTQGAIDTELQKAKAQGQQAFAATLAQQGYTESTVRDLVANQLIAQKVGSSAAVQQALQRQSAASGVWVNPRYGTWTGTQVVPSDGTLSVPASPTATPTPSVAPQGGEPPSPAPSEPATTPSP